MTQTLSSNNPTVGFINIELSAQTRAAITVNKYNRYEAIENKLTPPGWA
jgi:hypothetical protein